jgi:hypothetical protein
MGRAHRLVDGELASRIERTDRIVTNKRAHEQKTKALRFGSRKITTFSPEA